MLLDGENIIVYTRVAYAAYISRSAEINELKFRVVGHEKIPRESTTRAFSLSAVVTSRAG